LAKKLFLAKEISTKKLFLAKKLNKKVYFENFFWLKLCMENSGKFCQGFIAIRTLIDVVGKDCEGE
jgi:hypothetical protein